MCLRPLSLRQHQLVPLICLLIVWCTDRQFIHRRIQQLRTVWLQDVSRSCLWSAMMELMWTICDVSQCYCITLYCSAIYGVITCYIMSYHIISYGIIYYSIALYCIVECDIFSTLLYPIVLYYTVLYCTLLSSTINDYPSYLYSYLCLHAHRLAFQHHI